jgi:hypothetical protein
MDEILDALSLLDEILEMLDHKKMQAKEAQEQEEYDRLQAIIDHIYAAIDLLVLAGLE